MTSGAHSAQPTDDDIRRILASMRRVALVGASKKPERDSNKILKYMLGRGYDVVPVNPGLGGETLHGREVAPSLSAIPAPPIDMVEIFRRGEATPPIVNEAIEIGAKVIWMQLGVVNEDAAAKARAAGLEVVMDRCPAIEIPRLGISPVSA